MKRIANDIGLALVALAATVWLTTTPAQAHSFRMGLLVPVTGPDAETGREAVEGFLLATRERDGHPDETSDGHLGGLDVYVLVIDTNRPESAVLAAIGEQRIEFLAGIFSPALSAEIGRRYGDDGPFLIAFEPLPTANPTTMDGEPFAAAFARERGQAPGPRAIQAYAAARLIARAVRATEGDFSKREELRKTLAGALRR